MKEVLLVILKYYAIIGVICGALAGFWVCILSVKADLILSRGNTVKVKDGPTFEPGCNRGRMQDYFIICRAFGTTVMTFLVWPLMLYITITEPKWWAMVEEVETKNT